MSQSVERAEGGGDDAQEEDVRVLILPRKQEREELAQLFSRGAVDLGQETRRGFTAAGIGEDPGVELRQLRGVQGRPGLVIDDVAVGVFLLLLLLLGLKL